MWGKHGTPATRVDFLGTVPLFAGLPRKVLARLDGHLDDLTVNAGERLTTQGAHGFETFVVVDGTAEVAIDGRIVAEMGPGELIGEVAVLEHGLRRATVTARTPMRLLVIDSRQIEWLFSHPDLTKRVRESLAAHLAGSEPTPPDA